MSLTYMEAIGKGFQTVRCHALGTGAVYEDITWITPNPPTKAELDAYILADAGVIGSGSSPPIAVYSDYIPPRSGTTLIPYDKTVPLVTEGSQIWSQTVTPASAASRFIIRFDGFISSGSGTRYVTAAIFANNTCIGVSTQLASVANAPFQLVACAVTAPESTAPVTYSIRMGNSSTAAWYIGQTVSGTFGGAGTANVTMTELA